MMHRAYSCFLLTIGLCSLGAHADFSPEMLVRLHLPKIPKTFYFYDLSKVGFTSKYAYQQLIQKWQEKLNHASIRLFSQLYQELELTPEEIYSYMTNQQIIGRYHILKKAELILPNHDDIISEEDMDPEILLYLKSIFFKYTRKRNVKFFLTDQISSLTATYGSDDTEHFVFCHSCMYNKEHVAQYYESLQNQHGYFYIEPCSNNDTRWIEIPSLLQIGIIEAASHVEHQTNLFGFILANYSFEGRKASKESIELCLRIQEFHTLLEATFQSRHPLEVAVFLMKMNHKSFKNTKLWREIVKDIATTYDESSRQKVKVFSQAMKKAANHEG